MFDNYVMPWSRIMELKFMTTYKIQYTVQPSGTKKGCFLQSSNMLEVRCLKNLTEKPKIHMDIV